MSLPSSERTPPRATARPSAPQYEPDQVDLPPKRPWAVTANALLLVVEAGGFIFMAALLLGPLPAPWLITTAVWNTHRQAVVIGFSFAMLAVLALAAAVGFLRLGRGAWLLGVLVQGLNLALALAQYFNGRPGYVYVMMLYGIVMVLYLHQADVQGAFRSAREHRPELGEAA